MTSFAELTRQLTSAYERRAAIVESIMSESDPRGTRSERMAEFVAADEEYRRLDDEWRRAFHDSNVV